MSLWASVMGSLGDTTSTGNSGNLCGRLGKAKALRNEQGKLLKPGDKGYEKALEMAKSVQVGSKSGTWFSV